ncbi:hypothetical protein TNCV_2617521 [Trichonephila clavipes]|nr:hypothetical protein TNCV_2617521 [Trichonephila clavipes]
MRIARCTVFCFRILSFTFDNVDETSPEFFTVEFKLKVVEKAEKDGNREGGRYFEVDEKAVRNWCKQKDVFKKHGKKVIQSAQKSQMASFRGKFTEMGSRPKKCQTLHFNS